MNMSLLKLGKSLPKKDDRSFRLSAISTRHITVPEEWSVDTAHPGAELAMYANDEYGCCVISARAHQTLRFELVETGQLLNISDKQVIREYLWQTGGRDTGLVMLDSINLWRRQGWRVSRRNHKIKAFATIDPESPMEFKQTIYADCGAPIGVALPKSAEKELAAGKPWTTTKGPGTTPYSWGGHAIYVKEYNRDGLIGITWGIEQFMSWSWLAKYCDEAYAVIDAINTAKKRALFNELIIHQMLERL